MSKEDEPINVQRRRRSEPAGPGGRERAQAPRRQRPAELGRPTPPSGGGTGSGQRPPGLPASQPGGLFPSGGRGRPSVLMVVLVLVIICLYAGM